MGGVKCKKKNQKTKEPRKKERKSFYCGGIKKETNVYICARAMFLCVCVCYVIDVV